MDLTINEFARRICAANHTINDHGNPSRAVPCPPHLQIARQSWGLVQPDGSKTLGAIIKTAIESGMKPEFHLFVEGKVLESHVEDGVRHIDKIDATSVHISLAEVRHERLLHDAPNEAVPHG